MATVPEDPRRSSENHPAGSASKRGRSPIPAAPFDLNDFLPYRLSTLTNRVSRAFATLYSDQFDLSVPEWRVMAVLGQQPGLSADQVCARTGMDKVTVSRAVARLLDHGRVQREFASADRRRSVLELSARGQDIYLQIIPLAQEYESELVSNLTPSERQQFLFLLGKLNTQAVRCVK